MQESWRWDAWVVWASFIFYAMLYIWSLCGSAGYLIPLERGRLCKRAKLAAHAVGATSVPRIEQRLDRFHFVSLLDQSRLIRVERLWSVVVSMTLSPSLGPQENDDCSGGRDWRLSNGELGECLTVCLPISTTTALRSLLTNHV